MKTRAPILLLAFVLALVGLAPPAAAQANPCTAPVPPGVVVNPSTIYAELTDHETLVVGSTTEKLVSSYTERIFEQSKNPAVDPPFTTVALSRADWVLVPGTTNCYRAIHVYPVTPGLVYKSDLIATANPLANVANSEASAPTNPFGLQGKPRLGAVRVAP